MSDPPEVKASDSRKSSFASDVLTLSVGTLFAQAILILVSPVLTRLYGPEDFGLFALFQSVTVIFITVACLRYELAIMLPERDCEAANLLGLSILLAAATSALMVPMIWLLRVPLLRHLNAPELVPYLWMVPLAVFLGGAFSALNYWNSRTKRFLRLSVARVTSSVMATGTQIGMGLAGYPTGGSLIGAGVLGSAVSTLVLGGQIWRDDHRVLQDSVCAIGIMSGLRRYHKFPMIDIWSAFLNSLSWQIPVIFLSAFFSSAVAGFYALGFRVIQLPMSFVGSAVSQVFFQRCVNAKAEGTLRNVVENVFHLLVVFSLLPMLMLTICGRDIFAFVFGEKWAEAGVYVQFLGAWAFIWFISSTISTLYIVLERQEFNLKLNISNFITRFASIYIGGVLHSPRIAIGLFALAGLFVYGYFLIVILGYAGLSRITLFRIIFSCFVKLIPAGIILVAAKLMASPLIQTTVAGVLLIIFYLYIIKTDPLVSELVANLGLRNKFNKIGR